MLCAKFDLNRPIGSGKFQISTMYFCYFVIIYPGKGCGPTFGQTWIPFSKGCYLPSLIELGPVVLEKIFKFCQCIFTISWLSPLEKGLALHLNKFESPLKNALCLVWLEKDENVKSLQTDGRTDGRTDGQTTDDRWSEKLTWAFSSGELKRV